MTLLGGWKCTLDIIVEHAVLVAVFFEQTEGIGIGKVFKLDEAIYSEPGGWGKRQERMYDYLLEQNLSELDPEEAQDKR